MRTFFLLGITLLTMACLSPEPVKIIGHRGARGHIAENTLPSIQKALQLGVDGIEIDVFVCASGELVVFHDQTLDRLTNVTGRIEDLTLDSIQKIQVLGEYTIPTLSEVLDLIGGRVMLNIELKGAQTAIPTKSLLDSYFTKGEWTQEKILISSFNWDELRTLRNQDPLIPIAILTEDDPLDAIPIGLELAAIALNPEHTSLTPENVLKIKKAGFKLYPWTVNDPNAIANIIALGVDGIITDFPERIPIQ